MCHAASRASAHVVVEPSGRAVRCMAPETTTTKISIIRFIYTVSHTGAHDQPARPFANLVCPPMRPYRPSVVVYQMYAGAQLPVWFTCWIVQAPMWAYDLSITTQLLQMQKWHLFGVCGRTLACTSWKQCQFGFHAFQTPVSPTEA